MRLLDGSGGGNAGMTAAPGENPRVGRRWPQRRQLVEGNRQKGEREGVTLGSVGPAHSGLKCPKSDQNVVSLFKSEKL